MDLSFMSTIQAAEDAAKEADAKADEVAGVYAKSQDDNAANVVVIAGNVVSHMPRERVFDDTEQKIVQGRLWLISFTDLFSLILCFFIMLYSMKDPDPSKFGAMSGRDAAGSHAGAGTGQAGANQGQGIARVAYGDALNLDYLQGVLRNALSQVKLENDVRIVPGTDHLKLLIAEDTAFSGGALSADGTRIAKGLADRLMNLSNRITVVAVPDSSGDWATSLQQASVFAELMRDAGYRKSFIVVGEADGKNPGIEIRVEADNGQIR